MIESMLTPPTVSKRRKPKIALPSPVLLLNDENFASSMSPPAWNSESLLDYCQPCNVGDSALIALSNIQGFHSSGNVDQALETQMSDAVSMGDVKDTSDNNLNLSSFTSDGCDIIAENPSQLEEDTEIDSEDFVTTKSRTRKTIVLSDDESDSDNNAMKDLSLCLDEPVQDEPRDDEIIDAIVSEEVGCDEDDVNQKSGKHRVHDSSKPRRRHIVVLSDEEDEELDDKQHHPISCRAVDIQEAHNDDCEEVEAATVEECTMKSDDENLESDNDDEFDKGKVASGTRIRRNIVLSDDESDSEAIADTIKAQTEARCDTTLAVDNVEEVAALQSDPEDALPVNKHRRRHRVVLSDDEEEEDCGGVDEPQQQQQQQQRDEESTTQVEDSRSASPQLVESYQDDHQTPPLSLSPEAANETTSVFSAPMDMSADVQPSLRRVTDAEEPQYELTPPSIRGGASSFADTLLLPEHLPFSSPIPNVTRQLQLQSSVKNTNKTRPTPSATISPSEKENSVENTREVLSPVTGIAVKAPKPILKTPARTKEGAPTPGRKARIVLSDSEEEEVEEVEEDRLVKTPARTPSGSVIRPVRTEDSEDLLQDSETEDEPVSEEREEEQEQEEDSFIADEDDYGYLSQDENEEEQGLSGDESESSYDDDDDDDEDEEEESQSDDDDDRSHLPTPKKGGPAAAPFVTPKKSKIPQNYSENAKTPTTVVRQFRKAVTHDQLVEKLFAEYNRVVFKNSFPADMSITWNKRMLTTAGYCKFKNTRQGMTIVRTASVELSSKVLDSQKRLESTLLHELCHAATWIVDGQHGHGEAFYRWGRRVERHYPEVEVSRCHSYQIHKKHRFKCSNIECTASWAFHSKKGIDIERKRCGRCNSRIEYIGIVNQDGEMSKKREASGFSLYVKNKFAEVKAAHNLTKVSDVMKQLSINYKQEKVQALKGIESISELLTAL